VHVCVGERVSECVSVSVECECDGVDVDCWLQGRV